MKKGQNYTDWSRERLLEEVVKLKKRKKYGIVWEHKPEDVVEQCKEKLPVLKEDAKKAIISDPDAPVNLLIEGDNYHALSVLNYTHKGKISVIYADPPYNTGARDWKYNNDYVDINDSYRHSKWLSMMASRLTLARKLLKPNGVLIVTIDDHELPSISALLRDMGARSLGRAAICIKPEGRRQSSYLMEAHEYALFVSWGKPKIRGLNVDFGLDFPEKDEVSAFRWEGLMRRDAGREDRGSDYWFPFYVNVKGDLSVSEKKGRKEIYPINTKGIERVWLWDKERARENISQLRAIVRKDKVTIYYKRREQGRIKQTTFWYGSRYNANAYGTRLLDAIVPGNGFDYPKSIYSVLDCIDLFTPPDGIVLDYFAGSGTTGHAVMLLNKSDEGKRSFILATNNENGIAEKVTYARVKKCIGGVRSLPNLTGFKENLRYFKTAFVSANPTDANKEELTKQASEMLCVREGTYETVKETKTYKIFRNAHKNMVVIFDQLAIPDVKKLIIKSPGHWSVYVFSLCDDTFDDEFADMEQRVTVSPIPEAILRVYRRIFSVDNNYGA